MSHLIDETFVFDIFVFSHLSMTFPSEFCINLQFLFVFHLNFRLKLGRFHVCVVREDNRSLLAVESAVQVIKVECQDSRLELEWVYLETSEAYLHEAASAGNNVESSDSPEINSSRFVKKIWIFSNVAFEIILAMTLNKIFEMTCVIVLVTSLR
jgi:hypothetical protein